MAGYEIFIIIYFYFVYLKAAFWYFIILKKKLLFTQQTNPNTAQKQNQQHVRRSMQKRIYEFCFAFIFFAFQFALNVFFFGS